MKVSVANAQYRTPELSHHRGNPLICALPDKIPPRRLRELLTRTPKLSDSNNLSKSDRVHQVRQMRNLVVPTTYFLEFYNAVYSIIVGGYERRNPLEPSVVSWSYDVADPEVDIEAASSNLRDQSSATTTEHLFLTGYSGMGKTLMKNIILSSVFPTVILHKSQTFADIQIVYLNVEMPHDGSRATLLRNMLKAFDDTLQGTEDTNYLEQVQPKKGRGATIGVMESMLRTLCIRYHVGVIIIDEFQNLDVASKRFYNEMLQLFDSMSNTIFVPFLKLGTSDSLLNFQGKFRHSRRVGHTIEILPYTQLASHKSSGGSSSADAPPQRSVDWEKLVNAVIEYQVVKKRIPYSTKLDQELYHLSCGLPYVLFTLWQEAQVEAIVSGKETITLALLKQVYATRFKLLRICLIALRKNNTQRFRDLFTINQLLDKGDNSSALQRLEHFANSEEFSGVAATKLVEAVDDIKSTHELDPQQKRKLRGIRQKLEQKARLTLAGQTVEHNVSDG
ncbi:ATP-binding protein [Gilvimarinus xylanilyticus]|uniref:ATP-binding protein n=1 Tax=Gilvimarinus xylanilyticus TaxID=2944139 RepID=A0A9X2I0I6_9GAMM|nr:ATP-binding protein [Gilvimarinus xylanilyticus]MCP8899911.1 ATP-binding protein [Gilvimarinus xylanilyticus]